MESRQGLETPRNRSALSLSLSLDGQSHLTGKFLIKNLSPFLQVCDSHGEWACTQCGGVVVSHDPRGIVVAVIFNLQEVTGVFKLGLNIAEEFDNLQ